MKNREDESRKNISTQQGERAKRFNNRTVIVTGGACGMGASHARGFIAEGANVVINRQVVYQRLERRRFHCHSNYAPTAYRDKKHRLSHLRRIKPIVGHDENGNFNQW